MRSPIQGTVVNRHAVVGEAAVTETPLFTVADLSKMQLRQWPSCQLVAEVAPPGDNDVFCWVATWVGELFAAGWVTQPNEQYGIMFNDRDLEPQCHAIWERPEDQDYIMFELLGLPEQQLRGVHHVGVAKALDARGVGVAFALRGSR